MNVTRRVLVKNLSLAAGFSAALPWRQARSAQPEPERLDVNDPAAIALGYVENVAQVDIKKYPAYVQGSNCENCLQLQGSAANNYRPCSLFPGKLVQVSGWCTGWTPEM
jgi:High potential iron-sulfur protein